MTLKSQNYYEVDACHNCKYVFNDVDWDHDNYYCTYGRGASLMKEVEPFGKCDIYLIKNAEKSLEGDDARGSSSPTRK